MTCSGKEFMDCKLAKDCKCYRAVMRAYKALTGDKTIPDMIALEAAQKVYAFHRPEVCVDEAVVTVERWVSDAHIQ